MCVHSLNEMKDEFAANGAKSCLLELDYNMNEKCHIDGTYAA